MRSPRWCRSISRPRPTAATIARRSIAVSTEIDWSEEGGAARQADRRPLSRPRRQLLHRGRRLRPARERAHGAGERRRGVGLCRLVGGRAGGRDDLRADRGRCAGNADGPHPRRVSRLDRRMCAKVSARYQLALDGDGRLGGDRCGRQSERGASAPRRRNGWAARADEIAIDGGAGASGRSGKSIALTALAADGISAEGTYASTKRTYSYGAHAAHVAVDPKTGQVRGDRLRRGRGRRPHHQSADAARPGHRRHRAGAGRRVPGASRL